MKDEQRAVVWPTWPENAPSFAQLKEFFDQVKSGRKTEAQLKKWLGIDDRASARELLTSLFQRMEPGQLETITPQAFQDFLEAPGPLLSLIGTVVIPATTERFVAKERFVVDPISSTTVKIAYVGDNFKTCFLMSGDGKIEDPIGEVTLRRHKLCKRSVDAPIIAELGGEERVETTLTEVFSLMEKQATGQDGVLLTDGDDNVFYVRDANGVLCAVNVSWDVGWDVDASSVKSLDMWDNDRQFFSRVPA